MQPTRVRSRNTSAPAPPRQTRPVQGLCGARREERIKSLPQLESRIVKPRGWSLVSLNQQGRAHDQQAAAPGGPGGARHGADHGRFGHKDFYRLSPALFFPEQPWQLERGRVALQPARWYKHSLVAKQQLEALGFVIDLQVGDWATLNQRVQKPEWWEAYVTGSPLNPDPALHVAFRCSFQGWWCNEEKERLLGELRQESDVKKRKALVERIQTVFYEDVGQVKLGDYNTLDVARRELRGEFRTAPRLYFWNSWLSR